MSYLFAVSTSRPNAAQKAKLVRGLAQIDADLTACVGVKGTSEAAFYVEAPDNYGASHLRDKAEAARTLVKSVLRA